MSFTYFGVGNDENGATDGPEGIKSQSKHAGASEFLASTKHGNDSPVFTRPLRHAERRKQTSRADLS